MPYPPGDSLPGAAQGPRLADALALISARRRNWSPAPADEPVVLVGPLLPAGTSNDSFLVRVGAETLVLRIDGIDPARNAIDRETEYRLQRVAAQAGLAPRPRFRDAAAGVLLVDYLEQDALPAATRDDDVGALLRAIHALAVEAPRLLLTARLAHYEALADPGRDRMAGQLIAALSAPLKALSHTIDTSADTPVTCHNDLTAANRLCHDGKLYAIDWEYAASGSRWFDLAVAAGDSPQPRTLLTAYLQRRPTAREAALFASAQLVARYLDLLWQLCNTSPTTSFLQRALQGLQQDLHALADTRATPNH